MTTRSRPKSEPGSTGRATARERSGRSRAGSDRGSTPRVLAPDWTWSHWRIPPRALIAIVLVWALLFLPQLFLGRVFVLGDAPSFRPFAEFSRARWQANHERTFWNPYVFLGIPSVPSLADSRPQYLPDLLIDLYETVRPSRVCPLAGPLLAHLAGMLAMAGLAAGLWAASAPGVVLAAIAWGLMPGLLIPFGYGHDAQLVSSALIPVVVLGVHLSLAATPRLRGLGALGVAGASGLQCLTGHPQIVVYSGLLALGFACAETLRLRRPRRLILPLLALALGAAIGAAMWWTALLYSAHSFRSGGGSGLSLAEAARYSFAWRDLVSLIWPQAVGFGGPSYWGGLRSTEYSPYLGLTVLGLAVLGWRRRGAIGPVGGYLLAVAALSVLVSLGTSLGPVYELLHRHVPLWSRFRVPFYALVAAQLALALLAARGFAPEPPNVREVDQPSARRVPIGVLVLGGIGLIVAIGLATGVLSGPYHAGMHAARPTLAPAVLASTARQAGLDLLLRLALAAATLAALARSARPGSVASVARWALPALVLADLGSVAVPALIRATGPLAQIEPPPPPAIARLTAADHTARGFSARSLVNLPGHMTYDETYTNFWISWRARALAGTHGTVPGWWRPVVASRLTGRQSVLRAFGVTAFASNSATTPDSSLYQRLTSSGTEVVYRLRGALGRAYAVPIVVAFESDDDVVDIMASPEFLPENVAVTADAAAGGRYPGSRDCRITWIEDEPDRLALRTAAPAPAFVVIADTWFPGWEARVDGTPAPIHRVDQLVRGLAVPAGEHEIRMHYVPEGWNVGMWTTRAGLMLWLALAAALFARRRRDQNQVV